MAKYRFTNKAVEDLASIWNYTFDNWSERQADLYYEMLIAYLLFQGGNMNRSPGISTDFMQPVILFSTVSYRILRLKL